MLIVNRAVLSFRYETIYRVCCVNYCSILGSNLDLLLLLLSTWIYYASISQMLLRSIIVARGKIRLLLLSKGNVCLWYHFVRTICWIAIVVVAISTSHQPILHCLVIKSTRIVLWATSIEDIWGPEYFIGTMMAASSCDSCTAFFLILLFEIKSKYSYKVYAFRLFLI